MKRLGIILFTLLVIVCSCNPQPQPIDYGNVGCDYCRMTIVDKRYASQLVTDKGKAFHFDAAECMINYINEHDDNYAHTLVTNYDQPTTLIPVENAFFVRAVTLPSPMGMYITAMSDVDKASGLSKQHDGQIYSWKQLNFQFKQLPQLQAHHGSMK